MPRPPLFAGLIVDESENPVEWATVGDETFYVVDDGGFKRHVESRALDRQVLESLQEAIRGKEEFLAEEAMRSMGQEDIFTKAALEKSLRDSGDRIEGLLQQGLPEEARAWLGMVGFRVVVDIHGNLVRVEQPGAPEGPAAEE
ncbi:MAG: hypothetical protein ACRDHY_10855 [Anaerolineales bacterium]